MNLMKPSDWKPDEVTLGLFQDLDEAAHQINDLRPLEADVVRQVKEKLLGERVFSSNAIEGSTLTLRETTLILKTGSILSGPRRREALEAFNLGTAYQQIERYLEASEFCWNQATFLGLHRLLLTDVNNDIAGCYRNRDVMLPGAMYQPPGAHLVFDLMNRFYDTLEESSAAETLPIHPVLLATWVHWAIARIHPFEDGNGRMARLWQDFVLLRGRLTAAIIRLEDRKSYYEALTAADDGNGNPLMQLVSRRVQDTLNVYLDAQAEADELKGWASNLAGEASAREFERRRLEYERWRHAVERLRDAFERCATLITQGGTSSLQVQVHRYDLIDQSVWERLRAGDHARKTWYFRVWFRQAERTVWYIFFFNPHSWTEADDDAKVSGALVGLYVSEQKPGDSKATLLDDMDDARISCRELVVVDKRLRRRRKSQAGKLEYDSDVSPIQVAKEFIEEVISKELLR